MSTQLSALLQIAAAAKLTASDPHTGSTDHRIGNGSQGRRWVEGQASGQVDRVYLKSGALASGGSDTYDLRSAGQLTDIYGQDLDLGELKALVLKSISGSILFEGHSSHAIPFFASHGDGVILTSGQAPAVDFGPNGIDVSSLSRFHIHEQTGTAAAEYKLWFIGSNS